MNFIKTTLILPLGLTISLSQINFVWAANQTTVLDLVEIGGVKKWMPAMIIVKKDDKITIMAKSKVPGPQCLEIDAFNIKETLNATGKMITFIANKPGNFQIKCSTNPLVAPAQLLVSP